MFAVWCVASIEFERQCLRRCRATVAGLKIQKLRVAHHLGTRWEQFGTLRERAVWCSGDRLSMASAAIPVQRRRSGAPALQPAFASSNMVRKGNAGARISLLRGNGSSTGHRAPRL